MAKILSDPKVYSFLHVPVQSGSDPVLLDMKREYSIVEFNRVVDFLRDNVPGITIATDIICGFPTETEQVRILIMVATNPTLKPFSLLQDFDETMALVQQHRFPSLFINQFFPRPGTPAAKMPRIPSDVVSLLFIYHCCCWQSSPELFLTLR